MQRGPVEPVAPIDGEPAEVPVKGATLVTAPKKSAFALVVVAVLVVTVITGLVLQ
jgi:hypothetical protein